MGQDYTYVWVHIHSDNDFPHRVSIRRSIILHLNRPWIQWDVMSCLPHFLLLASLEASDRQRLGLFLGRRVSWESKEEGLSLTLALEEVSMASAIILNF